MLSIHVIFKSRHKNKYIVILTGEVWFLYSMQTQGLASDTVTRKRIYKIVIQEQFSTN